MNALPNNEVSLTHVAAASGVPRSTLAADLLHLKLPHRKGVGSTTLLRAEDIPALLTPHLGLEGAITVFNSFAIQAPADEPTPTTAPVVLMSCRSGKSQQPTPAPPGEVLLKAHRWPMNHTILVMIDDEGREHVVRVRDNLAVRGRVWLRCKVAGTKPDGSPIYATTNLKPVKR